MGGEAAVRATPRALSVAAFFGHAAAATMLTIALWNLGDRWPWFDTVYPFGLAVGVTVAGMGIGTSIVAGAITANGGRIGLLIGYALGLAGALMAALVMTDFPNRWDDGTGMLTWFGGFGLVGVGYATTNTGILITGASPASGAPRARPPDGLLAAAVIGALAGPGLAALLWGFGSTTLTFSLPVVAFALALIASSFSGRFRPVDGHRGAVARSAPVAPRALAALSSFVAAALVTSVADDFEFVVFSYDDSLLDWLAGLAVAAFLAGAVAGSLLAGRRTGDEPIPATLGALLLLVGAGLAALGGYEEWYVVTGPALLVAGLGWGLVSGVARAAVSGGRSGSPGGIGVVEIAAGVGGALTYDLAFGWVVEDPWYLSLPVVAIAATAVGFSISRPRDRVEPGA